MDPHDFVRHTSIEIFARLIAQENDRATAHGVTQWGYDDCAKIAVESAEVLMNQVYLGGS